ncbi:MAG: LCP family protein [Firmicutes bacterium]|nr:LCP family protein [Bacillota bacterium]
MNNNDEMKAYREIRRKSCRKRRKHAGFYKFTRILSILYVAALAVFSVVLARLDILPAKVLISMLVILVLLSAILFIQLFFKNIRMWAKIFACVLSSILLFVYSFGSAYALGTLDFLDKVSNPDNPDSVNVSEEPFNVLITGIDTSGTIDTEGRSDVNMVASVNPVTGKILLTSIPRDYYVRMPDHDYAGDKLTHTGFYGTNTTILAVEDLLGININYYVKVNFSTVKEFINAIGGIDVYSEYEFNPVKRSWWTVKKGWNHMNGKEALAFARERKAFPTGDNQRIKNQQAVMEALIKKATSGTTMLFRYNKILNSLEDYFEMNFSSSEIRAIIKLQITKSISWDIQKNTLTGHDASEATYSTGSQRVYVMSQDEDSINDAKDKIAGVMTVSE